MSNLRHRLKRAGVTLKEVSSETGASESTICHVLNDALSSKIKYGAEKLIRERIAEFTANEQQLFRNDALIEVRVFSDMDVHLNWVPSSESGGTFNNNV